MLTIWIIHRDAHHRAALARIAGAGDSAVLGGPTDRLFESTGAPGVIVLGLSGDFEQELEFVHRFGHRLPGSAWILLPEVTDLAEARRLFDTVPAQFVSFPPAPRALRQALRSAIQRRNVDSLSSRRGRDVLRDRFGRWFADLELPELMRAIDPRLAGVPVLIRGEEGTGRSLLARYVEAFGGSGEEPFVHVGCRGVRQAKELLAQIDLRDLGGKHDAWTIWLEDVDRLPLALQRRVQDWIEFGLPDGAARVQKLRWIAGAGDEDDLDAEPGLEPRLAEALSGITIRIPALRERPDCIERFVADTAQAWCGAHGERLRRFSADALLLLRAYPWPGNLHELEAVVIRTLSFSSADPLLPVHLRFPGDSGWLDDYETGPPAMADHGSDHEFDREIDLPEATILDDGVAADYAEQIEDALEPLSTGVSPGRPASTELHRQPVSAIEMATSAAESALPPAAVASEAGVQTGAAAGGLGDAGTSAETDSRLRRLVRAVAHEVRNPLVSIRTFSELLPDHYDDADFRTHFRELVGEDVRRIDEAVGRLQGMVDMAEIKSEAIDVAHMLESLLEEHREEIQSRRLLVLKELDHAMPDALGDPIQLRDAFSCLLHRAFATVSDRGDIYLASKHHATGLAGGASMRVLLRHTLGERHTRGGGAPARATVRAGDLDLVMAETIVQALGGALTSDTTDAQESVIVIDLPAPA